MPFFKVVVKNVLTILLMGYPDTRTLCSVCRCIHLELGLALLPFLTHSAKSKKGGEGRGAGGGGGKKQVLGFCPFALELRKL